jgi:hypothetical protein
MLRYAPRFHKKNLEKNRKKKFTKKNFTKFFVNNFFSKLFLAILVPQPIWDMPAKFWGSRPGPLVWEEIENAQTVHKGLAKLLYRLCPRFSKVWPLLSFVDSAANYLI